VQVLNDESRLSTDNIESLSSLRERNV